MPGARRDRGLPHVIHVLEWLAPIGGTEQVATQLAVATQRRGGRVTVIVCRPLQGANPYADELRAGGVKILAPSAVGERVCNGVLNAVARVLQVLCFPIAIAKQRSVPRAGDWLAREIGYAVVQPVQRWKNRFWLLRRLFAIVGPGSLVQVHFYHHLACDALAWAQRQGVPSIWHCHASMDSGLQAYYRKMLSDVEIATLASTSTIVVLANRIANDARTFVGPEARIRVIPNWVALPSTSQERKEKKGFTVGALGRLVRNKGLEELIEGIALLREQGTMVRCLLAGDGPLRGDLEALAERRGVQNLVGFKGAVPPDRVGSFLDHLDVLAMPSLSEAMPMSVLQAMAYGLPVVATDVGGNTDLVTHGVNGLVVPPGDAMALVHALSEMAANADRRQAMGRMGLSIVDSRYSETSVWPEWEELYVELGEM